MSAIKKEDPSLVYGQADLSFASRKVWLVKVPDAMAKLWDSAQGGAEVAQLVISPSPTGNSLQVIVPTNQGSSSYTLESTPISLPMATFSETTQDRLVRFEGSVQSKFNMVPKKNDALYKSTLKAKVLQTKKKNPIQEFEETGEIETTTFTNESKPKTTSDDGKERRVADKRERLPEDVVLQRIFAKFIHKEFVGFKEMNETCQQPETWLRELMRKVAIHHTSGPTKGFWSLKPDYKNFQARETAVAQAKANPRAFGRGGDGNEDDDEDFGSDGDAMDVDAGGDDYGGGDDFGIGE